MKTALKGREALAAGAAAAVYASTVFVGVAPAHADPCTQWGFIGPVHMDQDNGWWIEFNPTPGGNVATGVDAWGAGDRDTVSHSRLMWGKVNKGGIRGSDVGLLIDWNDGSQGFYRGAVDTNGVASGVTENQVLTGDVATWTWRDSLECLASGQAPPPNPQPDPIGSPDLSHLDDLLDASKLPPLGG